MVIFLFLSQKRLNPMRRMLCWLTWHPCLIKDEEITLTAYKVHCPWCHQAFLLRFDAPALLAWKPEYAATRQAAHGGIHAA